MGKMPLYTMLQKACSAGGWTMVAQLEGDAAGSQLLLLEGRPVWQRGDSTVLLQHLTELQGCTAAGIHSVAGTDIFAERFGAVPQLVVCGGGHVAAAVVQLAKLLGLTVLAMDDREEYAQQLRLAGADKVLCLPFDKALAQVPDGAETYFVVVTRAHAFDVDCLKVILKKPAAYVGMMGSRGRAALVRRQLLEAGIDAERVEALYAPHRAFHRLTDGRGDRTFHSGTDRIDQECASADGGLFICPSGSHGSDRCRRAAGSACCDCGAARLYAAGNWCKNAGSHRRLYCGQRGRRYYGAPHHSGCTGNADGSGSGVSTAAFFGRRQK